MKASLPRRNQGRPWRSAPYDPTLARVRRPRGHQDLDCATGPSLEDTRRNPIPLTSPKSAVRVFPARPAAPGSARYRAIRCRGQGSAPRPRSLPSSAGDRLARQSRLPAPASRRALHRRFQSDCVPTPSRRLSGSWRILTLGKGSTPARLLCQALDDRAFGPTIAATGSRELQ